MDGMFDVGHKQGTYRIAKAQAIIKVKPETISLIKEGKTPKGDIFEAAKVSGTLGAKKNSRPTTLLSSFTNRQRIN